MSPTKSGSKRSAKKKAPAKRKAMIKKAPMEKKEPMASNIPMEKKEERLPWNTGTEREGMEHEDHDQQWREPEKEPMGEGTNNRQ